MSNLTMIQQAIRLREMIPRGTMSSGEPVGVSFVQVSPDDCQFLQGIADRLERLSVHEHAIRKMVARG